MLLTLLLTVFRVKELTLVAPLPLPRPPAPFSMAVKNVTTVHLPVSNLVPDVGGLGGGGDWGGLPVGFFPPTNTDLRVTLLRLHP